MKLATIDLSLILRSINPFYQQYYSEKQKFIYMLIIHAAQKLLNTSRLPAVKYITEPTEGQVMHSWYARLLSSTFTGKLMVMYVHEPSLLTVVCRGKTIKGTWPEFLKRLPALMERYHFARSFIEKEMTEANDFVVAKTDSRSMLAHMNQMIIQLEYDCSRFPSYEDISLDLLEDRMMDSLYAIKGKSGQFIRPREYWKLIAG